MKMHRVGTEGYEVHFPMNTSIIANTKYMSNTNTIKNIGPQARLGGESKNQNEFK